MATKWSEANGPQSIWGLQDLVFETLDTILEARAAAEYQFLEKIQQELISLDSHLEGFLNPTRIAKGKLNSEPSPLSESWNACFISQFMTQFCSLVQMEFAAGKEEYERLNQELETFRAGAQAIRNARPPPGDVEQIEQSLVTAVRRCENAKEVYEKRCKEFQSANSKVKGRLGSLKTLKHSRNTSTTSLLTMDAPGINTADHDYRKAIVVANALREQRNSIYRAGYPTLESSTEQTFELVKAALLVNASLTMARASTRAQRYEGVVDKLMIWQPSKDARELCSFVAQEERLEPPEIYRHDAVLGWMKRVAFCVPLSYLPRSVDGIPRILEQCFGVCFKVLQKVNWDEHEAAHFATTPKLSASRFEEVIIAVEREESDLTINVRTIPEALGLMNYLFFSLPRPLLQLNSTLAADPDLCRSWWESSRDKRKVTELFRPDTLDKTSERTLRFLLEQVARILPHAKNLHIVDVAMAWARPLFQSPKPSNAEVTALCVLFRQALLLHRHDHDERWLALWNKSSIRSSAATPRSATPISSRPFSPTSATPMSTRPFSPTPATPMSTRPFSPTPATTISTRPFSPIPTTPFSATPMSTTPASSRQPTLERAPLSRQGTLTRRI